MVSYEPNISESDDFVIKGMDDKPVFISQEMLHKKIDFNHYGDFMVEKISFIPSFSFNY